MSLNKKSRLSSVTDLVVHGVLRLPYTLHVRYKRITNPMRKTVVFLHGLADTGELWESIIQQLPPQSNFIVIDLLGHGDSRYPVREVYSAVDQARHVHSTLVSRGIFGPLIIAGHSFGGLVGTEIAHRHPKKVRRLILIAPPIYRESSKVTMRSLRKDDRLRSFYSRVIKQPKLVVAAYEFAARFQLTGLSRIKVDPKNTHALVDTLRAGIINQKTLTHLSKISIPTHIIYGTLDPFLVPKNYRALATVNPSITVRPAVTGHAIRQTSAKIISELIQ